MVDTSALIKMKGEELTDLSQLGYQLILIPENIQELKFLSHSIARQMVEGFAWHNPLSVLNGAKVIDTKRLDVREERNRIYCEISGALDTLQKEHSPEDADFSFLAVARIYQPELIVTNDRNLGLAVRTLEIHARVVTRHEFRKLLAKKRELIEELEKLKEQVEKQPKTLVKCLVCGIEVESGIAYQTHFMENHSLGKAKKPENSREQITRENKKQIHTKRSLWRVISHATCTNVSFKDSKNFASSKQLTASKFSKKNHRSDEMVLVKTIGKENGETVWIYRPQEDVAIATQIEVRE